MINKIKAALTDKNDISWNSLVNQNEDEIVPILLLLIKDNFKNNKVPRATIESLISHLSEGIRLEDVMLLMRIK